ncbi:MAG: Stk1 family PASTA domain-containing Ser/Thr kinase, partial [Clostridia bacterium]|nr:Stk1 family PASTA domain-containing Ser/Thr kinase [Clostridia bacterium]
MDKYVGKRLDGRYELREIIGVGGMAYVYKAYDEIDDRIVAVKILKEEYINNEEFSRRFKNESKAIAILSHPNIVRVIDVSFGVNMQYIVMEYIDGITLKEYIEQQKALQWKEVVHFIVQILHALQHAHDKGIVHQDVKPQNIMLLSDGTIKVTDFGIARFSRVSVGQTSEHGDKAIGSVHYISPEQARAEITDEKSDIYSVGVMMYEMLTGKLPFESDNAVSVAIMQMQSVAERPTVLNPDIPEGLEEITLKAMQKEPSERYQSAAEMLYDIDEFKNNPSIRFEYQYLSGTESNTMHYEEAFRSIRGTEKERPARRRPERQSKVHDQEADGETENTFPLIPVLAGVAGALVLVALVVMLFVFLGSFGGNNADSPNTHQAMTEFEVPTFVGQNYELDIKNNEDYQRNFTINVRYEVSDGEAGEVLNQSPKAGLTVKKGSLIVLTVSSGKEKVAVPTVKAG